MTDQNYDDAIAELGRTDGMDAETVAALERRLLQAFTDHHSTRVTAGTDDVRSKSLARFKTEGGRTPAATRGGAGVRPRQCSSSSWEERRDGGRFAGRHPYRRCVRPSRLRRFLRLRTSRRSRNPTRRRFRRNARRGPARLGRSSGRQPFVALPGTAGLPDFESGTIVRLELSLASLPSYGVDITRAGTDRPVEADVLVGQDGQPRAIRLVSSGNARTLRSQQ